MVTFSAACATDIAYRNHFLFACLLNEKRSAERIVIMTKGFLKLPNLHILIKQKSISLPRNFALGTFGKLLIMLSTNVK